MRSKGMKDLATFSVREVKRAAAEERDEYSSAEEPVGINVGGKPIPASFLKVEGRGAKDRRKMDR